jgi:sterol desaturase/sphingolipid hydroxylase (fatty acid hydroxylase superfamily)
VRARAAQVLFYHSRWKQAALWKSQPDAGSTEGGKLHGPALAGWAGLLLWWPPSEWVVGQIWPEFAQRYAKPDRHPFAAALCMGNLLMICIFAAFAVEGAVRGHTSLLFEWGEGVTLAEQAAHVVYWVWWSYAWENVVEWAWHWTLHQAPLYGWFHKIHHYHKHPEPFDDMIIHPLEACGYYCIMYAPCMLFSMHWVCFATYVALIGVCGVFDHSGVRLDAPLSLYAASHHDEHHRLCHVNYGFPSSLIDVVLGTFHGDCCGRHIVSRRFQKQQQ